MSAAVLCGPVLNSHGHTDEPHNQPNPPTHPSDRETTESAADSTAGKKTPGGAGTNTRRSRDTRAHKGTRTTQTNLTTIQTHQQHTFNPHVSATTEAAADST